MDDDGKDKDVATHRLTVQGGFCNVSVNCSAKDIWASYTCDHAHCTQVENTTSPSGVNIIFTATNGTIHCSSSNRVDTKTQSVPTKDLCGPYPTVWEPLLELEGEGDRRASVPLSEKQRSTPK
ncbi:hypothetical protein SKAU_G00077560 [Synaphobranchus kaupii]|uniref:Uncharacterized protein n=1 Tax=Synaphobranchus kaupii TaxID=118154 RepID=A0A9Q1JB52_SYNKA|nr:hypothetical protein SKAU_G00077560 [Synaphobranchus kaupii]